MRLFRKILTIRQLRIDLQTSLWQVIDRLYSNSNIAFKIPPRKPSSKDSTGYCQWRTNGIGEVPTTFESIRPWSRKQLHEIAFNWTNKLILVLYICKSPKNSSLWINPVCTISNRCRIILFRDLNNHISSRRAISLWARVPPKRARTRSSITRTSPIATFKTAK